MNHKPAFFLILLIPLLGQTNGIKRTSTCLKREAYNLAVRIRDSERVHFWTSMRGRGKPKDYDTVMEIIEPPCGGCPDQLRFLAASVKHSNQHFISREIATIGDVYSLAREGVPTSISNQYKLADIWRLMRNKAFSAVEKLEDPSENVFSSSIKVSSQINDQTIEYKIVYCKAKWCPDDNSISGRFKKGDIMTIIPLCGPGVVMLPRRTRLTGYLDRARSIKELKSRAKVKAKECH